MATGAMLAVIGVVLVINEHNPAPANRPAGLIPLATPSPMTSGQLAGTWYGLANGPVHVNGRFLDLRGGWSLFLETDGVAQLDVGNDTVQSHGRWSVSAGLLSLDLPFPGCAPGTAHFRPVQNRDGTAIEALPGPDADPCPARDAVLGHEWTPDPYAG